MNAKALLALSAAFFAINVSAGELYGDQAPVAASQSVAQAYVTPLAQYGELNPAMTIASGSAERSIVVTALAVGGELGTPAGGRDVVSIDISNLAE
jgi:hypothetical protein